MNANYGLKTKGKDGVVQVQGYQSVKISVACTSNNTLITDRTLQTVSIPLSDDLPQVVFVIKLTGERYVGGKEYTVFTNTPFLLHARFGSKEKDKGKAIIDTHNGFIQSDDGRTGYIDADGNIYVRVEDKLVTSKKDCTQANLFVNDPNLLCRYLADIIAEDEVLDAAKETAQEISEAEKTAARIAKLEAAISQRDTILFSVKKYFADNQCCWGIKQALRKLPTPIGDAFLDVVSIHWTLVASNNLLETDFIELTKRHKKLSENFTAWKKSAIAMREAQRKSWWFWQRSTSIIKALASFPDAPKSEDLTSGHRNMKR